MTFEEWFMTGVKIDPLTFEGPTDFENIKQYFPKIRGLREAFEAGAESKQKEIDNLKLLLESFDLTDEEMLSHL